MRLPNFIIVGAMKSGTSTLRDLLALRNDVFIAPGEVHFFSDPHKYARGLEWYASLFAGGNGAAAIGEKTPTYSFVPECADRIHRDLPNVKLVWLFRNPVSRTYSHYWHSVKNGSERLSFRDAIEREPQRVLTDRWRGYQLRSLYHRQVENYLRVFPREQMHFVVFEQLLKDPKRHINDLLAFLGIDPISAVPPLPRSNVTFIPRSRTIQWLSRQVFGRGNRPSWFITRFNRRRAPGYPVMDPALRAQLRERFVEPNRRLAELTGLDLSSWER
jgi:hypothetical protein